MAEHREFLEKLFNGVTTRLDKIQKDLKALHDVQHKMKQDIAAIHAELKDRKKALPADRSFPIKEIDEVDNICRKFSDARTTELVKEELKYTLANVASSQDDWLRYVIQDDVVAKYHTAEEIRLLNFIQYVIRYIAPTSDKIFTSLVTQAKGRMYARVYRQKKRKIGFGTQGAPAKKPSSEAVLMKDEIEVKEEEIYEETSSPLKTDPEEDSV